MANQVIAGHSIDLTKGFSSRFVQLKVGEELFVRHSGGKASVYRCHFTSLTISRFTDRPEWLESGQAAARVPCLRCDERLEWSIGKFTIPTKAPGTYFYRVGETAEDFCGEAPFDPAQDTWLRVVVRGSDDYLGYLQELFQTPFLISPKATVHGHQTDLGWGSDCAAFAIYGRRRMGGKVGYGGPRGIVQSLTPLTRWLHLERGGYFDSNGHPADVAKFGLMPGDVLHSGEQVSVFYEDHGIRGVLDPEDLVIQAQPGGPAIVTLRKNGYFPKPIRAFKWLDN